MLSDARIFASKNDDHPAMLLDGGVGSRSRSVMVGENDRDRLFSNAQGFGVGATTSSGDHGHFSDPIPSRPRR